MGKKIQDWALANYDKGGHWIVETMEIEEIEQEFKSLKEAKEYCLRRQDRMEECQGW